MIALVYLENNGDRLPKTSLSTLRAALELKSSQGYTKIIGLLLGEGAAAAASEAAQHGLDEVVTAEDPALNVYLAPAYADAVSQIAEKIGAAAVVGLSSARGKDFLPRVAQRLGAAQASDILAVLPGGQFKRPMYAGNLIATIQLKSDKKVITVRATAFEPANTVPQKSPIRAESLTLNPIPGTEFISYESVKSERPELTEADVIVSGGRALKSTENFDTILVPLADALGAALGASRAAVDSGYVPNDWQVGQTGKVVAPRLYIAVGISGAIQHLAGMKDSKVIVAINKDPECPMVEIADYSLIGDLFQIVPELTAAIRAAKAHA